MTEAERHPILHEPTVWSCSPLGIQKRQSEHQHRAQHQRQPSHPPAGPCPRSPPAPRMPQMGPTATDESLTLATASAPALSRTRTPTPTPTPVSRPGVVPWTRYDAQISRTPTPTPTPAPAPPPPPAPAPVPVPPSWFGPEKRDTFRPVEKDPARLQNAYFRLHVARMALHDAGWRLTDTAKDKDVPKGVKTSDGRYAYPELEPASRPPPVTATATATSIANPTATATAAPRGVLADATNIQSEPTAREDDTRLVSTGNVTGMRVREKWGNFELEWDERMERVHLKRVGQGGSFGSGQDRGQGEGSGGGAVAPGSSALPQATESREGKRKRESGAEKGRKKKQARPESSRGENGTVAAEASGSGTSRVEAAGGDVSMDGDVVDPATSSTVDLGEGVRSGPAEAEAVELGLPVHPASKVLEPLADFVKRIRDGHDMGYSPSPLSGGFCVNETQQALDQAPGHAEEDASDDESDDEEEEDKAEPTAQGADDAGEEEHGQGQEQVEMSRRVMASCVCARTHPSLSPRANDTEREEFPLALTQAGLCKRRYRSSSRFVPSPLPRTEELHQTACNSGSGFWEGAEKGVVETAIRCVAIGRSSPETSRWMAGRAVFRDKQEDIPLVPDFKRIVHAAKVNASLGYATLEEYQEGMRRSEEMAKRAKDEMKRRKADGERRVREELERKEEKRRIKQAAAMAVDPDTEWARWMGSGAGAGGCDVRTDELYGSLVGRVIGEGLEVENGDQYEYECEFEHDYEIEYQHSMTTLLVDVDVDSDVQTVVSKAVSTPKTTLTQPKDKEQNEDEEVDDDDEWDELEGFCLSSAFPLAREWQEEQERARAQAQRQE